MGSVKISLPLSVVPVRFCPSETLAVLNDRQWICSYSGGKDSTTLVTWIEYLRRIGMVKCETPRLVMSDTGVEYPFLQQISADMMARLSATGWKCEIVRPAVHQRLYCRIFGIGNTPVHPGGRKMRWCSRSTKIDPMNRFSKSVGADTIQLSGVRWGESDVRDEKLELGGCAAGGECGLPAPSGGVYGPIITWRTCKVLEWLAGEVEGEVRGVIADLLPMMRRLIDVYELKYEQPNLYGVPPKASSMRFGCIGCPAISNEKITKSKQGKAHAEWSHLRRIYGIWDRLYAYENRCLKIKAGRGRAGPVRLEARKRYFAELLDIQAQSGVTLVTPEDIAFIHDCWERKVYPRGWSEADEATEEPEERNLITVSQ